MTDKIRQTYSSISLKARFSIIVSILVIVLASSIIPAFAVNPVIVITNWRQSWPNPGLSVADPKVSCYVTDSVDNLNPASIVAKIDGQIIPATLETYPIVGLSKTGTIRFAVAPILADGIHNAEVTIVDNSGNSQTNTWGFTVAVKPQFSALTPANGSGNGSAPTLSAIITDNGTIDWNSLYIRAQGIKSSNYDTITLAELTVDKSTGTIVYNKSPYATKGEIKVSIIIKDINGNEASTYWTFWSGIGNPQFDNDTIYYLRDSSERFINGRIITDGILKFQGTVTDAAKITSLTAKFDGALLSMELSPGNTGYKYSGVIKDGNHTLVLNMIDEFGTTKSLTRTFIVCSPPVFSNITPAVKYGLTDLSPLISLNISDTNGTIDPQSVILSVDGVKVSHNYDTTVNKVTYQSGQLSDESYHTMTVEAKDNSGNKTTKTWKFFLDSRNFPDMADSNVSNCIKCHPSFTTLESHPLTFDGDSHNVDACQTCHAYISQATGPVCTECHDQRHGDSTGISYNATNYNSDFPLRVKTNREMLDCVICHQPGSGVVTQTTLPKRLLNNHDIPELHKYTEEATSCNSCHAKSLTKEHAIPGRVDKDGKAITCNTCHNSTDPLVVSAIASNKKNCDACHTVTDHDKVHVWNEMGTNCQTCHQNTLSNEHLTRVDNKGINYDCDTCHNSTDPLVVSAIASNKKNCDACHTQADHEKVHIWNEFDTKCQSCHQNSLSAEHMGRIDSSGKNYACGTCHDSKDKAVVRTIASKSLSCAGCHKTGHNITLAGLVPTDIPQYPDYKWSTPFEANIFEGGPAPTGYESGQVLISNRRSDVTVDQVWNYYNVQADTKMVAKGWTIKSSPFVQGTSIFTAEYEKGGRSVTIKCYKSALSDGLGPLGSTRIEIWFIIYR